MQQENICSMGLKRAVFMTRVFTLHIKNRAGMNFNILFIIGVASQSRVIFENVYCSDKLGIESLPLIHDSSIDCKVCATFKTSAI